MKKKISILLIGLMILGLVACGGNANTAVTQSEVETEMVSESASKSESEKAETKEPEVKEEKGEEKAGEVKNEETAKEETEQAGDSKTESKTEKSETSKSEQPTANQNAQQNNEQTAPTQNTQQNQQSTPQETSKENSASGKPLVVYFSATGTTKGVAQKIASALGADIYEIKPAQPYTADDLNYSDSNSRSTREQNDSAARPAISGSAPSFAGYDRIYIGYPIWWGEEPRIMDTFVESYNFSGITMIPFCTSGGSGVGRSDSNLANRAGSGNWKSGRRFSSGVSESEIKSWADGIQ